MFQSPLDFEITRVDCILLTSISDRSRSDSIPFAPIKVRHTLGRGIQKTCLRAYADSEGPDQPEAESGVDVASERVELYHFRTFKLAFKNRVLLHWQKDI